MRVPLGEIKRRRAAAKFAQIIIEITLKILILLRAEILLLQFAQRMDKRLRHIPAAIGAKAAGSIRNLFTGKSTHEEGDNTKRNKEQKSFEERLDRSLGFDHLRLLLHLFEANQIRGNFPW